MHEDWYSYEFMRRGIAQGLEIKGLNANSNIMLQQLSLVTEFGARLDLFIAKCIAFKNKGALLNLLKPYGLVESEDDIIQGVSDFSDENDLSLSASDIEQTAKDIWNSLQAGLQKYPSDLIELSL